MKEFIIDGNNFNDLEGFYCEIDKILTKGLNFKTGHNLDAFNDILRGGFGVFEEESITLKWRNYKKSKEKLGNEIILKIIETILDFNDSGHDCKLELY